MREPQHPEARATQLVAELAAGVATAVVRDLVHLAEEERVRRDGQHQHAAGRQDLDQVAERPTVVVDVLEHVEQAQQREAGPERREAPLVDQQQRGLDAPAHEREAFRVHVAGSRQRHAALPQERQQASAAAADVEERAPGHVGDGVAQHVAHHLAPGLEPVVLALHGRERREVVRVEARRSYAAGAQVEDPVPNREARAAGGAARPRGSRAERRTAARADEREPGEARAHRPGPASATTRAHATSATPLASCPSRRPGGA